MANVSETIPDALQPQVKAALSWFNEREDADYEVTGIVDADQSLTSSGEANLRLVLCGGDTCEQQRFRVSAADDGYRVEQGAAVSPVAETAELDPPPGARRQWIQSVLNQHRFVVLVFYRGFW